MSRLRHLYSGFSERLEQEFPLGALGGARAEPCSFVRL